MYGGCQSPSAPRALADGSRAILKRMCVEDIDQSTIFKEAYRDIAQKDDDRGG
jgi:hypothetical protein